MPRKLVPGVYRITNKVTGDCYVGSSKHVHDRCHEHQANLRKNAHINRHLQAAWNKYGEAVFECDVLEECAITAVIEREQYWIDALAPAYNIRKTAESNLGIKISPEGRARHRQAWQNMPPERQEAIKQGLAKGWHREHGKHAPETIAIIKEKRAKQETTPAMLEALKQGQEVRKQVNPKPRLGMKNSEEMRRKQSEAAKNRPPRDPEVTERIAGKNRGRKQSETEKQKRAESMRGHTVSEATREQIAETNRATWAAKTAEEKRAYTQKRPPVSEETRRKQSESAKHRHNRSS